LIFLAIVSFVFWIGGLIEKPVFAATGDASGGASDLAAQPSGD
jgi:hypothetical protein